MRKSKNSIIWCHIVEIVATPKKKKNEHEHSMTPKLSQTSKNDVANSNAPHRSTNSIICKNIHILIATSICRLNRNFV